MKKLALTISCSLLLSNIAYCSSLDRTLSKVICEFSKTMEEKGLKTIGTGGSYKDGKIRQTAIRLRYHGIMDVEMARKLLVNTTCEYIHYINNKPNLKNSFLETHITCRSLELIISGEEPTNLSCDYVRSVALVGDELAYWKSHPDPHILHSITVHEETFEEAVAIVKASQDSCSCQGAISLKTSDSSTEQNCSDTSELPEPALAIP